MFFSFLCILLCSCFVLACVLLNSGRHFSCLCFNRGFGLSVTFLPSITPDNRELPLSHLRSTCRPTAVSSTPVFRLCIYSLYPLVFLLQMYRSNACIPSLILTLLRISVFLQLHVSIYKIINMLYICSTSGPRYLFCARCAKHSSYVDYHFSKVK
jgi:hypothetical protein